MGFLRKEHSGDVLFSVIVPVYNVEQYVRACLLSVIEQNYENIEIIVVDDGSKDSSLQICIDIKEEFKNKTIKIIHQENRGLSVARNVGIENASGKFILFLDSDDMLQKNSIQILDTYVKQYNADLYLYDGTNINETDTKINEMEFQRSHNVMSCVMSGKEYMANWYVHTHMFPVWLCLFRTDYIRSRPYWFTKGKLHEDISFSFKTVLNASNVLYIPEVLYIRRYHENSITSSKPSLKNYDGILTALEECVEEYMQYKDKTEALSNAISFFWCYELEYVIHICKEWNGDKKRAEGLFNAMLEELLERRELHRGYTWFSSLNKLLSLGEAESFEIKKKVIKEIEYITGNMADGQICKKINSVRMEQRWKIVKNWGLDNPFLTIGIYGIGNHSRILIEYFQKYQKIQAKIFFIVSEMVHEANLFMGYKVYNCQNIPHNTDKVIISSFVYHGELLLASYKMQKKMKFQIIDPYEIEHYPIF